MAAPVSGERRLDDLRVERGIARAVGQTRERRAADHDAIGLMEL
jgi:hypothetical protein